MSKTNNSFDFLIFSYIEVLEDLETFYPMDSSFLSVSVFSNVHWQGDKEPARLAMVTSLFGKLSRKEIKLNIPLYIIYLYMLYIIPLYIR